MGIIYVNGFNADVTKKYLNLLKCEMPKALFVGISVINSSSNWLENGISISFLIFESSNADLYVYRSGEISKDEMISDLVKKLNEKDNTSLLPC